MKRSIVLAALLAIACGGKETRPAASVTTSPVKVTLAPPSPLQARELIATSGPFSEYEFTNAAYTLPMQQSAMNSERKQAAADLRKAGWIHFDGDGGVVLSAKAAADKRWLVRQNGVVDLVPLAHKEVDTVRAITSLRDGNVQADFAWHWVTNEVGTAFRTGPVHDRYAAQGLEAVAILQPEDGKWSVLRINSR